MTLTALGFLAIFASGLVLAFFRHPLFGLLVYLWAFYNPPLQRWWGFGLPDLRWSLIAGCVTLVAVLFHSSTRKDFPPLYENWCFRILLILSVWIWTQSFWAINSSYHFEGSILVSKYVLLFFLIYRLVNDIRNLEMFVLANVIGGFIFGWVAYTESGTGRLENVGGPGVSDANTLAMHLAGLLTLAGFLFMSLGNYRKWIVIGCIPFILNGIILTISRGAFVGIACGGLAALVLMPARKRKMLYGVGFLGAILVLILGHDMFWIRMETILPD